MSDRCSSKSSAASCESSTKAPASAPEATAPRLVDLASHRCGTVIAVQAPPAERSRLAGLGICVGRVVQLLKHGDPMIVRACGARVGISRRLADQIMVEPCNDTACLNDPKPHEPAPSAAPSEIVSR